MFQFDDDVDSADEFAVENEDIFQQITSKLDGATRLDEAGIYLKVKIHRMKNDLMHIAWAQLVYLFT